ncbi:RHS repeat domain-containing protein [Viridibacillus sp. NPDC096237]|uniref:RHS repeat domain-containing protein n=1 Tax=Viridibacillus sp. NPDC096237 TaxID=3390721 RepID=UPI003CFFBB47
MKSVAPSGEITTYTYEGPSLVESTIDNEKTTYLYDSFGRIIQTKYPNKTFEKTTFDDEEYTVSTTDKNGNTKKIVYTKFGQEKEVTDADNKTIKYTYDPLYIETITSITDGNGNPTKYEYDNNHNISTITNTLKREKSYTYNDNDQIIKVVMPKMTFEYKYDLNGEMSMSILPSGIETRKTYTEDNQIDTVQTTNGAGDVVSSTNYQYDDLGNISQVLQNDTVLKDYSYTDETNLLAKYGLKLFKQSYTYDDQVRLTARETAYDKGLSIKEQLVYKEDSDDVEHVKYSVQDQKIHDYRYEKKTEDNQYVMMLNGNLLKKVSQYNDANVIGSLTYTTKQQTPFEIKYDYTKNGNVAKQTIQGYSTSYEYDGNNQLTKETYANGESNSYEYDAVGNRKVAHVNGENITFDYNEANQIVTKNDVVYEYDKDGNLIQDERYYYTYNEEQQLTNIQTLIGEKVASYTYDENGLRLTKTVGNIKHEYFYNEDVLDMEVVKQNDQVISTRYYEWSSYTPLGMIVQEKGTQKAYQFITNQRGDVLSIRDGDDNEVGSYSYDAYGNILTLEGSIAKENPIRYAGYYYDDESENYYLQARYYNPANGAFLALDPLPGNDDEPLSQNGYTYGNNNPVKYVDPLGEDSKRIWYAIVTGVAFAIYAYLINIWDIAVIAQGVVSGIKAYAATKNAKRKSEYKDAGKILQNSKVMKKNFKPVIKKTALKAGVKAFATVSGGAYLLARMTQGIYYGYKNSNYKYAPCWRNAYYYAQWVTRKELG